MWTSDYERYDDRLDELRDTRRTCATCAHDGQCDGLPYCGGSCWEPIEPDEDDSLEEGEVIYGEQDEDGKWLAAQEAEREWRENALDAIKEGDR